MIAEILKNRKQISDATTREGLQNNEIKYEP